MKNGVDSYSDFKAEFWAWFDLMSIDQKEKFWYYHQDMAEINFYITVYKGSWDGTHQKRD